VGLTPGKNITATPAASACTVGLPDDESETASNVAGGSNMERIMETIVLVLANAMVAPLPYEEIVGDYGRLALAVAGFLLIFWWLFRNDHRKDLRGEL
jgi:hypothetical protein